MTQESTPTSLATPCRFGAAPRRHGNETAGPWLDTRSRPLVTDALVTTGSGRTGRLLLPRNTQPRLPRPLRSGQSYPRRRRRSRRRPPLRQGFSWPQRHPCDVHPHHWARARRNPAPSTCAVLNGRGIRIPQSPTAQWDAAQVLKMGPPGRQTYSAEPLEHIYMPWRRSHNFGNFLSMIDTA